MKPQDSIHLAFAAIYYHQMKLKEYKLACCSRTQFIFNEVKSYEIMFK